MVFNSKYNLRKKSQNKKNGLTFVCSYISEKKISSKKSEDNSIRLSLNELTSQGSAYTKEKISPQRDQFYQTQKKKEASGKIENFEVTCQDKENLKKSNFLNKKHKKKFDRKEKRIYKGSCKFRLKFTFDPRKEIYIYNPKSRIYHDHPPPEATTCEVNKFKHFFRNSNQLFETSNFLLKW